MRLLIAVGFGLSAAWLWDRLLRFLKWNQKIRVGIGAPVGEELIKYSLAVVFQLQPWLFYLSFGVGEGILESLLLKKRFDLKLIAAGALTHFSFGLLFLFRFQPLLSLAFAIATHSLWNNLLIRAEA